MAAQGVVHGKWRRRPLDRAPADLKLTFEAEAKSLAWREMRCGVPDDPSQGVTQMKKPHRGVSGIGVASPGARPEAVGPGRPLGCALGGIDRPALANGSMRAIEKSKDGGAS